METYHRMLSVDTKFLATTLDAEKIEYFGLSTRVVTYVLAFIHDGACLASLLLLASIMGLGPGVEIDSS